MKTPPNPPSAARLQDHDTTFDQLASRRLAVIDLERAARVFDQGASDEFWAAVTGEVPAMLTQDARRALLQGVLVEIAQHCAWEPAEVPVRPVSQSSSADPTVRRAARVLAMVHELHKAGYQRIRILPYLAPSGGHWRCSITSNDNMADDGYRILQEVEGQVAFYTTGQGPKYFGWEDAEHLSARQLAERFLRAFPLIAEHGQGRDWMYAGWLTDVLGRTEQGRPDDLLCLLADWDLDPAVLRDWQPPPPLRTRG